MNTEDLQLVRDLISEDRHNQTLETYARHALVARLRGAKLRELSIATLPVEMAILAAQQVNEVRLKILETPKEVGWGDVAFEFVLGFLINSGFMEKLAVKVFSRLFAHSVLTRKALNASGKRTLERLFGTKAGASAQFKRAKSELAALERAASQRLQVVREITYTTSKPLPRTALLARRQDIKNLRAMEVEVRMLADEVAKEPKATAETPKQYAELVALFTDDKEYGSARKDSVAFFKATKDAVKKAAGASSKRPLSATDGSSVAVTEHFYSVARAQRLEIEVRYAELEQIAMSSPLDDTGFDNFYKAFDPNESFDVGNEQLFLDEMASDLRLRLEAMIWMKHLGFSEEKKHPTVNDNSAVSDIFTGIPNILTKYLLSRFGALVVEFKVKKGGQIDWGQQEERVQARELREYLWAMSKAFT